DHGPRPRRDRRARLPEPVGGGVAFHRGRARAPRRRASGRRRRDRGQLSLSPVPARPPRAALDRRQRDHGQGLPQPARRARAAGGARGRAVRRRTGRDPPGGLMDTLGQDVRYAVRGLLRTPGFTALVLAILVLGGGLGAAIFTVVDAALLRPLPYPDPERLVWVSEGHPERGNGGALRPANFLDWRSQNGVLEGAAAFSPTIVELAGDGPPERLRVERVTEDFFPVLGVPALLGRTFAAGDYRDAGRGRDPGTIAIGDAAVLAYGFWQRRFGGDPAAIGRTVRLNGKAVTVIGVMPDYFQGVGAACPLWLPWWLTPEQRENRQTHEFFAIARTKRDVGLARARAEMS